MIGILLAAGQGQRFGGDKCLAPLADGRAMVLHAAESLFPAVDKLVCVIRADDHALQHVCETHGLSVIHCSNANLGMSASLKAGILAHSDAQGWLVALGDMPLIKTTTCQRVVTICQQQQKIIVPSFQGKRGHPVAFPSQYRDALLALKGDQGAKPILQQYVDEVLEIPVDDAGVCWDVDTREGLQLLLQALHKF